MRTSFWRPPSRAPSGSGRPSELKETPLHRTEDVLATLSMIRQYKLDVRTVTMGIDLQPCAAPGSVHVVRPDPRAPGALCRPAAAVCREVEGRYGIPIVNRRIAVSPIGWVAAGQRTEGLLAIARTLDAVAAEVGVDLVGGFSALVQKGWTEAERRLIASLPEVLSTTERVCASVNVGTTAAGINMDAILALGHVLKETAERTSDHDGFGCAKLVIFANAPSDNPFMAGAFHGPGEPDCVINIGVSGPGVVKAAVEDLVAHSPTGPTLGEIAEEIKSTAFRVTRVGELIGREVAARLGVSFGIVDLSLAPTPQVGDSVGEILQAMGVVRIGAPGSTAALALLERRGEKGRFLCVIERRRALRCVRGRQRGRRAGPRGRGRRSHARQARGHDGRLLGRPRHDRRSRRDRCRDPCRPDRRRGRHRRDQPQDDRRSSHSRPRQGRRRPRCLRRPVWRDRHTSRPRRGRLDGLRPSRRTHPRAAIQPSKLKKSKKPLGKTRKLVTLPRSPTHRKDLLGQHPRHQRRMES